MPPVIVVLGAVEGLAGKICAQIAQNADWERGLGTSIRKGVAELHDWNHMRPRSS